MTGCEKGMGTYMKFMECYYDLINGISIKMQSSRVGKNVYDILEKAGVRTAVAYLSAWLNAHYNEKHPNEQMRKSKIFFKLNKKRVKNVLTLLCDSKSREVLEKMIYFRCYSIYCKLPPYEMKTIYFINDFFHYAEKEIFVDCGAYTGDTVRAFIDCMKFSGGEYEIVAFEPDANNYCKLIEQYPDIKAIQAGVWNEDGKLFFNMNASEESIFIGVERNNVADCKQGNIIKVPVKSMDNVSECQNATFIKMDIEGSEYNALLGAKNIICKNKPKLAICIYHSDEDMLRIIELVHEMVPEYRLYVRQHHNSICETVLYATL